jgi:transposase
MEKWEMVKMDEREMKGMMIAQSSRIRRNEKGWIVPSQSGHGAYLVYNEGTETKCDCPDCELRGVKCKHQWAVEYFIKQEIDTQGNTTTTKSMRITYTQDWGAYNKAQTSEVNLFDRLFSDLVKIVPEPPRHEGAGRPRLSLQETIYCAIEKVYSQLSSRRACSLYGKAKERGDIEKSPCYNVVNLLLNREDITPILHELLAVSALPLRSVETTFAPDSSGFSTNQFGQYAVEKYRSARRHKWIKAHVLVGTKTNVIASARITDENASDYPQFEPMVMEAHQNGFDIREIPADKGYSSRANYEIAESIGATAYIPFRSNATGRSKGSYIWRKMYHFFQFNKEEFLEHYHKRSNAESAFKMVKMKFGDKLKSKNPKAQENELLCKLIAHNIVVLIHEMYELGIDPNFCSPSPISANKLGGDA